jgi:hydrogenase-4 component F
MLFVVFMGMSSTVLTLVLGDPTPKASSTNFRDGFLTVAPIMAFMVLVLMLGVYLPRPLDAALHSAADFLIKAP